MVFVPKAFNFIEFHFYKVMDSFNISLKSMGAGKDGKVTLSGNAFHCLCIRAGILKTASCPHTRNHYLSGGQLLIDPRQLFEDAN